MADESTTEEEVPPPPSPGSPTPPPPGDPVGRPPLRRSRTDRVVAGVAGGIGRYFDVDPVLVRIAFVVLSILGGSGVLLYIVAWLVIAKEGNDDSPVVRALRGHERRSGRGIIAVILVIGGVLIIGGPFLWATGLVFGEGLVLPLLLITAGVALLVWPENHERHDWHQSREGRHEARARVREDLAAAQNDVTQAFAAVRDEVRHDRSDAFDDTGAADASSGSTPSPPPPPMPPVAPEPPKPRRKSFVGPLTLAVLLLFTGAVVALDQSDLVDIDPAVALAVALTIIGVALTVTAFMGRARGLIALGVFLLPIVWWFHAVDLTWWEGIGDERIAVDDLAELDTEYRFGIGQLIVDLSDLDLEGETRELAVGLTIGELVVLVPDDIEIVIDADGRIGELQIDGPVKLVDDGFDVALDQTIGDPAGGTLELDLDIGIGSGRVEVQ